MDSRVEIPGKIEHCAPCRRSPMWRAVASHTLTLSERPPYPTNNVQGACPRALRHVRCVPTGPRDRTVV
eukprot:4211192-Prymnesium_polylepis.1